MHTNDPDVFQTVDFGGYVYHLFIDVSMPPKHFFDIVLSP